MYKLAFKTLFLLVTVTLITITSCSRDAKKPEAFSVRISDKPMTFCNPISLAVGSERARRAGEPVVVLYKDDYYLFITGGRGYWYSGNMRDWTYVNAPDFPGGCPSVASDGKTLYASGDKGLHDVFSSTNPKNGVWNKVGTYQRDYGDADMFIDDDGRFYMYWGWSQVLPFRAVELDPDNGFKEKGEPVTCFFGDYEDHGFERRRKEDVIFPFFSHRPYFPEESPWIEGPWMIKHNGKYYLQYAAIGLEFSTYSHGVYVADKPLGPFKYSQHNPLTYKTTGFMLGAGHGSTFHDKNGDLWTIAMVPSFYGGRGGSDLALFPTAVDAEGVMHSNTAFGDYPQYYPGIKEDAVDNNFTGWMLLSNKKYEEASSSLEGFGVANAVDENFLTHWCAGTGNSGEWLSVEMDDNSTVNAIQVNFADNESNLKPDSRNIYYCYRILASNDGKSWDVIVDKSNNTTDACHDYTELEKPVKTKYIKIENVRVPDGKFSLYDLRIFGIREGESPAEVKDFTVERDKSDTRKARLEWPEDNNATGYIVNYGTAINKLYTSVMVYDINFLMLTGLNKDVTYYFSIDAFNESGIARGTRILKE